MAQSLSRLWTHLIFSTKGRFPFLADNEVRRDMHAYLATVLPSFDCETLIIDGHHDHVHALFALSRRWAISTVVKDIKRTSSSWIKNISPVHRKFHWQNGYGAFSVSQSHLERVSRYIGDQERHHKQMTFEDEYRKFLRKYQIKYDERYVGLTISTNSFRVRPRDSLDIPGPCPGLEFTTAFGGKVQLTPPCTLPTAHSALPTAHRTPHTAHCTLHTAHCPPPTDLTARDSS